MIRILQKPIVTGFTQRLLQGFNNDIEVHVMYIDPDLEYECYFDFGLEIV